MKKKSGHTLADEVVIRELYHSLLDYWNERSARLMGSLFANDGYLVGFDGTVATSKISIKKHLTDVFLNHKTDPYIGIIKSMRFITPRVVLVHAHAGMVPRGQKRKVDINTRVNTIQTLVAAKNDDGDWYISLFQNTPAQFHGRPEAKEQFSNELRTLLKKA